MSKVHFTPVHPGDVLQDELKEVGLTQSTLAKHIGVLPKTMNEICRCKRGIRRKPSVLAQLKELPQEY